MNVTELYNLHLEACKRITLLEKAVVMLVQFIDEFAVTKSDYEDDFYKYFNALNSLIKPIQDKYYSEVYVE